VHGLRAKICASGCGFLLRNVGMRPRGVLFSAGGECACVGGYVGLVDSRVKPS
jgi:hypothetical protein